MKAERFWRVRSETEFIKQRSAIKLRFVQGVRIFLFWFERIQGKSKVPNFDLWKLLAWRICWVSRTTMHVLWLELQRLRLSLEFSWPGSFITATGLGLIEIHLHEFWTWIESYHKRNLVLNCCSNIFLLFFAIRYL